MLVRYVHEFFKVTKEKIMLVRYVMKLKDLKFMFAFDIFMSFYHVCRKIILVHTFVK